MAGRTGRRVARLAAFWDTSALVPLCVRQGITPRAIALYQTHDVVVWWSAPVEIASALARLVRMNQLSSSDLAKARQLAKNLADSWSVIQPSDALRTSAAQTCAPLRSAGGRLVATGGGAGLVRGRSPGPRLSHRRPEAARGGAAQRFRRQADVMGGSGHALDPFQGDKLHTRRVLLRQAERDDLADARVKLFQGVPAW